MAESPTPRSEALALVGAETWEEGEEGLLHEIVDFCVCIGGDGE